jgi:hypothetical protein
MQSLAPSEYFPGIKFNYSFYTTGDTKVTLEYVNNNFLKCTGYAYSRAISTSFNGIIYALGGIETTDITASGTITANLFSGSGASLTSLNASNISDGTLSVSRGGTGVTTFGMNRILYGSGGNGAISTLPDLTFDGSTLTCYGEFATYKGLMWMNQNSRLSRVLETNQYSTGSAIGDIVLISDAKLHLVGGSSGAATVPGLTIDSLNNIGIGKTNPSATSKLDVNGTIAATLFSGSGASLTGLTEGQIPVLTAAKIPDLDAAKITAGTIANARLPAAISVTSLEGDGTNITAINASNIATGTIANARLPAAISVTSFEGDGASITAINASNIATGTINNARLPAAISVTSFEGDGASITAINASNIATGTINNARLPTDISVNNFTGNGASITNINATNIATGTINEDRISLTTNKLYENFNTTNFAVIDDKIDLPANYSFNITDYDSQTLFSVGTERKYKGKMTANYDDRRGVYKLITTENRTDNVAVLNYKVGDKISIRNTANAITDYAMLDGFEYHMSTFLYKRPSNLPLAWNVNDGNTAILFEWKSTSGTYPMLDPYIVDSRVSPDKQYPFTTIINLIIEAGFNYYLSRVFIEPSLIIGGNVFMSATSYGDDYNDFNREFGAGQTFKLQIGSDFSGDDYYPLAYTPADIGIASERRLGGVKKGRGVAIDATTGELSSVPVSSDLINSMNTSHFKNNTVTGKIDIDTNLAELKGPKGDDGTDGKGWTGATYNATTGKVSFASGDALGFDTGDLRGGKGDKGDKGDAGDDGDNGTNGKGWTGATYSATTGKVSFTSTDGTPYVFDTGDLRGGTGATGKGWTDASYNSTTGIVTFNSGDGLGFTTGNLKGTNGTNGTNGKGWTGATYNATTGKVSFASTDGTPFVFETGDLRGGKGDKGDNGTNGKGWTGATYSSTTGKVSFASSDGTPFVFDTGDLRGGKGDKGDTGLQGIKGDTGIQGPDGPQGIQGIQGLTGTNGKGWKTGSAYNASTGVVSFLSDDGLGFSTGDLRGAPADNNTIWLKNITDPTKLYYNDGNVGIGTTNPQTKLHIRDNTTGTTALTIQNNNTTLTLPDAIVVAGTTPTIIGTDRCISFPYSGTANTKDYTFTTTENLICDILMIGGGGSGGIGRGGGGGAGSCIIAINQMLIAGNYSIRVGKGQVGITTQYVTGTGNDSEILYNNAIFYRAKGGGSGGQGAQNNAVSGGSAGGAASQGVFAAVNPSSLNVVNYSTNLSPTGQPFNVTPNVNLDGYAILGNRGGMQNVNYNGNNLSEMDGAGGGGIGGVGGDHLVGNINGSDGGSGLNQVTINSQTYNFQSYFNNNNSFGVNGYIGGGGGGGNASTGNHGNGGSGGGGGGLPGGVAAIANTGSGGGGGSGDTGNQNGGTGGSGLVIIRYRRIGTPTSSSTIELLRGTNIDNKTDYKIGNYDGSFKVKLAVNNYEADVLSVAEVGGIVSFPFGLTTPNNALVSTLNNINPSDWLRKSECVLITEATTRTLSGSVWTSVFHIQANTIRSYYPSPNNQWRLRIGYSVADTLSTYVYGFFLAAYDQHYNTFASYIELQNSGGGAYISQNFDGYGTSRCIITIINDNSPRFLNINIA